MLALLAGSMLGKWVVRRLGASSFELLFDGVFLAGAAGMLVALW
ncbi:hypothetical protein SMF913_25209 [Streptomyces malaysiensis]|uniref:Uncharacterized protein n=1 Tax=Streptomyces malaysiensis TaxID=92644 RepID=A0A2J7YNZ0_STRMQ|nr:hypothetical protein SMF913_25209 [Streptomyces malaysiensis]